jgi:predicted DNA-binding ribbon-helix-helix protein
MPTAIALNGGHRAHQSPICSFRATGSRNVIIAQSSGNTVPRRSLPLRARHETAWRSSAHFMKRQLQKSLNTKRSVRIGRHKTSVSLEDAFWKDIREIAAIRKVSLPDLLAAIDTGRHYGGLSSAIRLFVLEHYRALAERRAKRPIDEKGRPVRAAHSAPI